MQKQLLWTQEFLGMSLSSFFQYMTHYALIAALPVFVIDTLKGNDWQAGLAMTFFQIGAVFCRPLAGKWLDEFNKQKMLAISLGFFLLISIMYLGVGSLYSLLVIRLLHGAVFAIGSTTVATLAVLVLPSHRKGEGIGYFAMFSSLAMVIGPFFSLLIIAHYKFNVLFAGCVVLAILSFWCGNRNSLPDIVSKAAKKTAHSLQWNSFIEPKALPMALIGGLLFFAYAGVLVFIPIYAKQLNLIEYTSVFFALFALVIVATRPIVGKLFDRSGANSVVYPGLIMFVLGLIGLSQVQGLLGFLTAGVIIGMGFGALSPTFQTLAIQISPRHRAGVATATYFLALDISVGLGSFLLSVVASHAGYRAMYLFASAVGGLTAVVYYVLWQQKTVLAG
jgi:MFS family permease